MRVGRTNHDSLSVASGFDVCQVLNAWSHTKSGLTCSDTINPDLDEKI